MAANGLKRTGYDEADLREAILVRRRRRFTDDLQIAVVAPLRDGKDVDEAGRSNGGNGSNAFEKRLVEAGDNASSSVGGMIDENILSEKMLRRKAEVGREKGAQIAHEQARGYQQGKSDGHLRNDEPGAKAILGAR